MILVERLNLFGEIHLLRRHGILGACLRKYTYLLYDQYDPKIYLNAKADLIYLNHTKN